MRIVGINPLNGLNPPTFKSWADRLACRLRALPGSTINVDFDDYDMDLLCLSKGHKFRKREGNFRHQSKTINAQRMEKISDKGQKQIPTSTYFG